MMKRQAPVCPPARLPTSLSAPGHGSSATLLDKGPELAFCHDTNLRLLIGSASRRRVRAGSS